MGEMKFVENPRVNKKVIEVVETLKEEIIFNFHPKSIILSGSFGKGEVTVIEESGKLKFMSDCEIIIIPYKYIFSRKKIYEFESNFYERTGLKVGIWGATLSFYILVPFFNKKMKPTMENYDLKYGSKVIYGKNYVERIPDFKSEEIPLWEGIRLLFNRMAEALEHFSLENPSEEMVFWTDKIVLACQDALLLSLGEYHFSYRKRNEMFQNLFSEHFSGLESELPNLLNLTIEATERKLNGTMNVDDPVGYWFDTAKICDKVFRYTIEKDMGITLDSYVELQELYLKHPNIRKKYYRGLSPNPMYQNLGSAVKMWLHGHKIPTIKLMQRSMASLPWAHIVYSIIPTVYFSLSIDGKLNYDLLEKAKNDLELFKVSGNHNQTNVREEWKYLKKQIIDLWCDVCY